jgi:hypothetical protein
MKITTGLVTIPVERDGTDVGSIAFNPNDFNFADKFYKLYDNFKGLYNDFEIKASNVEKNTEVDEYGVPLNTIDTIQISKDLCHQMYCQINDVFGENTSDIVFGGAYNPDLIEVFFNEIAPFVENAREEKTAKYLNREQKRAAGLK